MIIVLDTTALHRDVHAARPILTAILERAEAGEWKVVVPRVVIEEAARQYPVRLREAMKLARDAARDLRVSFSPLDLPIPIVPTVDVDTASAAYEPDLRGRLSRPNCAVAEHPPGTEVVGSWAARRRKPFKLDGTGAADAFVWLTVCDCARRDDVVFITGNSHDFADPDHPDRPAPELRTDLEAAGIDPVRVRIVSDVVEFVREFIEPSERALARATALLVEPDQRRRLVSQISLAAAEYPTAAGDEEEWELEVDLFDFSLKAFDADDLHVISAQEAADGRIDVQMEASGQAAFDFFMFSYEALVLPEDTPISVWGADWEDKPLYVLAEAVLRASALIEASISGDNLEIRIDSVDPDRRSS